MANLFSIVENDDLLLNLFFQKNTKFEFKFIF